MRDNTLSSIGHSAEMTPREKCIKLFSNLYHIWDPTYASLYPPLYKGSWINRKSPLKIIEKMNDEEFDEYWKDNKDNIKEHLNNLDIYLQKSTLFQDMLVKYPELVKLEVNPIAYFSMEFGLVDWLHIYSGGLGVLAGDLIKQASDSGLPMIGIGIFYHHGYFLQKLGNDGEQIDEYPERNIDEYPLKLATCPDGECAEVEVNIDGHPVYVRAWLMKIGRRELYLLDTNFYKNERYEDKMITAHLYGGDEDTRIRQEILLGIGGYKILEQLNIKPSICHMNEGHSAFVAIAMLEEYIQNNGVDFHRALPNVRKKLIFTNHTLKTAGNDIFPYGLVERYLSHYASKLNVQFNELFRLGEEEGITHGQFSMTIAGFNNSKIYNGVSKLHAKAAKSVWPNHDLLPITNGAHVPTWISKELAMLIDEFVDEKWYEPKQTIDVNKINDIPDELLWKLHVAQKERMIDNINRCMGTSLQTEGLFLSWFRRFATYKRPDIVISHIDKLKELVNIAGKPVYILMGGKAHPRDTEGRAMLQRINQTFRDKDIYGKAIFLPEYNWGLAQSVLKGSDVWVNTPLRFEEASGTSGMKASFNGVLQFTTLDGWTDEVDWKGKGWTLPDHTHELFFGIIRDEIIPEFHDRDEKGLPRKWIKRMKRTMMSTLESYSSKRMLNDYIMQMYYPLLKK